jgi:hypothetical protein
MSLINDALKRAKQVQQEATPLPAPNLQLRPIEPTQYARKGFSPLVPGALAVVAVFLLVLVWQRTQRKSSAPSTEVHARVLQPATPTTVSPPAPAAVALPTAAQPVSEAAPAPPTEAVAGPGNAVDAATAPMSAGPPAVAVAESKVTNTPAAAEPPPPRVALPKLQAIVFSPTRPSVMIGGRTLFIGDKLNGLRVTAIGKDSVTLVGAGQTNVLTLPD